MARTSGRLSRGSNADTPRKRHPSTTAVPSERPKRAKTKTTPTKSQYFKAHDNASQILEDSDPTEEASSAQNHSSDFHNDGSTDAETDEDNDTGDERTKPTPVNAETSAAPGKVKVQDLLKPGVTTGLGPGRQVVIKKPKARPAGTTPYADETIHPNTLMFLEDLKANNNRQWLKLHDAEYRQSEKDWYSFVEKISERLMAVDDTIPELPVKDIIFRIYRDVRFSSDKTPYKPHFSAAWSRTGRKGPYAHYYVQVAPNESFVGGGLWQPEAAPVAAMRRDIDRYPERIKNILLDDGVRQTFLKGVSRERNRAIQAFVDTNSGNALKTKPKGYDSDHKDIDLLRLKSYTIGTKITNKELLGTGGLDRVEAILATMKPFITYLNSVVMPDDSSEESEGNDDEASSAEEDIDTP